MDVYAFGIMLWEIITECAAYEAYVKQNDAESLARVRNYFMNFIYAFCSPFLIQDVVVKRVRPPIGKEIPQSFAILIQKCWDHEPRNRPTFEQIILQLYLSRIDVALRNSEACAFWTRYYLTNDEVIFLVLSHSNRYIGDILL